MGRQVLNEKFNQNVIHWTITLITPLFGIVHFKTNYNYRLSNHCFINELILVTYALISNAVEKTGYNIKFINVLQQTACLVVNPIMVGNFAFLFNCKPVGRTSDSMTVPRLIYS